MKKRLGSWLPRLFLLGFLAVPRPLRAMNPAAVPGAYELRGAMEMAGGLMLHPNHKYVAEFSYGAADWVEEGLWKIEGEEVVLSGARFKAKNYDKIPFFLPPGTRLKYQKGDLSSSDPERKFRFENSR